MIVCRQQRHKKGSMRGYIAMIAVDKDYRKKQIGMCEALSEKPDEFARG